MVVYENSRFPGSYMLKHLEAKCPDVCRAFMNGMSGLNCSAQRCCVPSKNEIWRYGDMERSKMIALAEI